MRVASCSIRFNALRRPRLVRESTPAQELRVAADGREGRAQLVRGVGDELAQPLLRRRLLGERVLDLARASRRAPSPVARSRCPAGPSGTRRVRSPEAMASAVVAICRKGRRPRRTTTNTSTPMASRIARLAKSSILRIELSVSLVGFSDNDVTSVPCGTVTATVRYAPSGSPALPARRRLDRDGRHRRSARLGPGCRCRGPAARGWTWSRWAPGSGLVGGPDGRRRITFPLRSSSVTYTSEETRREKSDLGDRPVPPGREGQVVET